MSKKSKPQIQYSTQTTTMPDYVVESQKNLLGSGQRILDPYLNAGTSGYGIAGFNQDQQDAFQGVRDIQGGLDPESIQKFLNPYTRDVVDTTNATLRDENDRTLNQIRAKTAAGSSFGGSNSRGFLMEAEANRHLGQQQAATTAQLMANGYDKATATAITSHGLQQEGLQALLGIGNQQQQQEQSELDVPLNALTRLAAITPQQYGSTTTGQSVTTGGQQQASGLQTVLGGLLSLGGMKGTDGASIASNLFGKVGPMLGMLGLSSDRDDKTDITPLGKDDETGLPLYSFRYRGDPKSYPKVVGPMAQDVEKTAPGSTRRVGRGHLVITGGK